MTTIISGLGAVSAAGIGCQATARRLYGEPVVPQPVPALQSTLSLPLFGVDLATSGSRTIGLLHNALHEALHDAQLSALELTAARTGVCIGTTVACQLNNIDYYRQVRHDEVVSATPLAEFINANPAEVIQRKFNLRGPALTVANACSSGTDAIAMGHQLIQSEQCDIVIAGGADELSRIPVAGFNALGVCSKEPCRPFDADRSGLNLGEGAGVVILLSSKWAERHGKKGDLILAGYGTAADGYHITAPHPDGIGLERAVCQALRMAEIVPQNISFINAHGTGTDSNDRCEANTLIRIFGKTVNYLSTKRFTGHTLGAAGALEFIFSAIMLRHNRIPISHGFSKLPADIPCPPVTEPIAGDLRYALSTSLAFGGCNSAIIIRKRS